MTSDVEASPCRLDKAVSTGDLQQQDGGALLDLLAALVQHKACAIRAACEKQRRPWRRSNEPQPAKAGHQITPVVLHHHHPLHHHHHHHPLHHHHHHHHHHQPQPITLHGSPQSPAAGTPCMCTTSDAPGLPSDSEVMAVDGLIPLPLDPPLPRPLPRRPPLRRSLSSRSHKYRTYEYSVSAVVTSWSCSASPPDSPPPTCSPPTPPSPEPFHDYQYPELRTAAPACPPGPRRPRRPRRPRPRNEEAGELLPEDRPRRKKRRRRKGPAAGAAAGKRVRGPLAGLPPELLPQQLDPDDLPKRARWTIAVTACLLLVMSMLLVGVTLRMAPIIDEMVRKQNEEHMNMLNRANLQLLNSTGKGS